MRTIGFYSFKGGVGRSNLLLNLAYYLAADLEKNVGIIDLDLEAPGLTVLSCLAPTPVMGEGAGYPDKGMWDFLNLATKAMKATKKEVAVPDIKEIFYETKLARESGGSIFLAPAYPYFLGKNLAFPRRKGRGAEVFKRLIDTWEGGRSIGADVFAYMRKRLEEEEFFVSKLRNAGFRRLDYLLVDMRTGLTELADAAVGSLFTELVLVSGLNTQNVDGMLQAIRAMADRAEKFRKQEHPPRIRILPVISPIPNGELDRVRKRLGEIYESLKDLAKELRQEKSLVHLVLPHESPRPKAPKLKTIHYCDYLGVEDGVLLKEYPETLTAREILEIAEDLVKQPEAIAEEKKTIREATGAKGEKELPPLPPDPCWRWVFDYWDSPPDWRWPVTAFGTKPLDDKALLSRFPEGIETEVRERILSSLAAGLGADKEGKLEFIRAFKTWEDGQFHKLLDSLGEEQANLTMADESKMETIALRSLDAMADWMRLMETLAQPLVSESERLARIQESRAEVLHVPHWALLLLLARRTWDEKISVLSGNALLRNPETPPDACFVLLKALKRKQLEHFPALESEIRSWVKRILKLDRPEGWYINLGILLVEFGLIDETEAVLRKATERNTRWAAVSWNNLGILLDENLGRYEEAEQAYRKAIDLDPKKAIYWNNLASFFQERLAQYDEAEKAYRWAIGLDPKYANPWTGLGALLAQHLARYEEAEDACKKAIDLDPKDSAAWNGLGILFMEHLFRYEEAEEAYREAISCGGQHAVYAYANLFILVFLKGAPDGLSALTEELRSYIAREKELRRPIHPEPLHAFLFALADKLEEVRSVLDRIADQRLRIDDQVICWICARLSGVQDSFDALPEASGARTAASHIENIIENTAIVWDRLAKEDQDAVGQWIRQALAGFTPPVGSRPLNIRHLSPFLKVLGIEEEYSA